MEFGWGTPIAPIWEWVLLLARVLTGITFLHYGIPKIRDLRKNSEDFEKMGFKPGMLFGTGIALLEVPGSALLIIGVFPAILALLFSIHMMVGTIWKITSTDKGFADWSYDLLILAILLLLLTFGPGKFTIVTLS